MQKHIEIIKKCAIFKDFNETDILIILENINARAEYFSKNENVFNINDDAKHFAILLYGKINIQKIDYNGNLNIISNIKPSELFGEAFVYSNMKKIPVLATCLEDSYVLFIDKSKIENLIKVNVLFYRKLNDNMLTLMARKLVHINKKVDILTKQSLRDKVLVYLSSLPNAENNTYIEIPFNREQLADYLCVNRASLSRELSKMKDENIIDYHKNIFKLL